VKKKLLCKLADLIFPENVALLADFSRELNLGNEVLSKPG
jgi:hypothetical protein